LLELGFGSGREAAFLLQNGHDVRAIDASAGMVEEALRRHPELSGRLTCEAQPLQEGSRLLGESFDAVLAIAVLMHIPDSDLFETIFQLKRLLKPRGMAFISVSTGRAVKE